MNPREQIEAFFVKVHPVMGESARCPTGEPYTTYAIVCRTEEAAIEALVNTFRVLVQGTALIKPEGAPVCIDGRGPRYLYWRRPPECRPYEPVGDAEARECKTNLVGQWWQASCRAVVSELWRDSADSSWLPEFSQPSLEALLVAVFQLRTTKDLRVQVRPEDVLHPDVIAQLPRGLR